MALGTNLKPQRGQANCPPTPRASPILNLSTHASQVVSGEMPIMMGTISISDDS